MSEYPTRADLIAQRTELAVQVGQMHNKLAEHEAQVFKLRETMRQVAGVLRSSDYTLDHSLAEQLERTAAAAATTQQDVISRPRRSGVDTAQPVQ